MTTYPWLELEVGDSFFLPGMKINSLSQTKANLTARTGRKFTARTVDGGVRVWRIA